MADDKRLNAIDLRGSKLFSKEHFIFPERFRDKIGGILVPEGMLRDRCSKLIRDIYDDFSDSHPVVVPMLDGANWFYNRLFYDSHYTFPITTRYLTAKSYEGMDSTEKITFPKPSEWDSIMSDLKETERPVLIIEDIVDSGRTLGNLLEKFAEEGVQRNRIKLVSLFNKPCKRSKDFEDLWIDYLGFVIDDYFIVGAGLDLDDDYRELPFVGVLEESVYAHLLK